MKKIILILVLLLADAAAGFDLQYGRSDGMGGSVMISSPDASDLIKYPLGRMKEGYLFLQTGVQRKFELSDLDKVSLAAAFKKSDFQFTLGFSQMGRSEYYVEQVFRSSVAYRYDSVMAGLILSGRQIEFGRNIGTYRAASFGLAAGIGYDPYYAGIVLDNINRPRLVENLDGENVTLDIYGEINGGELHSITGRLKFEKYEKPHLALGQYIHLAENSSIFWGITQNPLTYGGGIEIIYSGITFVYGARYHPDLGFTHNVSLGYSLDLSTSSD